MKYILIVVCVLSLQCKRPLKRQQEACLLINPGHSSESSMQAIITGRLGKVGTCFSVNNSVIVWPTSYQLQDDSCVSGPAGNFYCQGDLITLTGGEVSTLDSKVQNTCNCPGPFFMATDIKPDPSKKPERDGSLQ